jgi:hypothetical protein
MRRPRFATKSKKVDRNAGNAADCKRNEASRDKTTKPLVEQQHKVFPDDKAVEFALPVQPLAKFVWDFGEPVWAREATRTGQRESKSLGRRGAWRLVRRPAEKSEKTRSLDH